MQLRDGVFGLDEEAGLDMGIARAIDWSLFQSKGTRYGTYGSTPR